MLSRQLSDARNQPRYNPFMAPRTIRDDGHISERHRMSSQKKRAENAFEPAAYRKSIAEMFGTLDPAAQRDLADRFAVLPRHIHAMAQKGLIAVSLPNVPPIASGG
jgi:hypothetical protein